MQNIYSYDQITAQLRHFFQKQKGFVEVPAQSRLSILAACEDPKTVSSFSFSNTIYPLPQTGQMWLEYELLKNPGIPGVFCVTTSYRNEPNPIPGRHDKIFPMFEFESAGGFAELQKIERELLQYLGFPVPVSLDYRATCAQYETEILHAEQETLMWHEFGNAISLEKFPLHSNPFWNMKQNNGVFNKIDVILYGMETIGSAERSTDAQEMRDYFFTISDGEYAELLFGKFGKDRVVKELDEYLSLPFFERFGGGIGVTRMERAMRMAGLLKEQVPASFVQPNTPFGQPTL
jgi:aspartyl/asparaginyl-tRNA synthetase